MRSSRTVAALLIAAGTAIGADVTVPEWIPPDTKVLFGVSLRTLMDSPVIKSARSDMEKMSADLMKGQLSGFQAEINKAKALPVTDFFKDVDDIVVAATAEGTESTQLIVLHGRFEAKRFPGTPASYNGVSILADAKGGGAVALVDESTAIAGDLAQLHAAIDRRGKQSGVKPALVQSAALMAARFDVWGVGDLPESVHPTDGTSQQIDSIDHFEFGASFRQGLDITGVIHARTPKDAEQMAESMKLIEAMLKAQPASANGTKFDLRSFNGTIQLSVSISEEQLRKSIEAQKAGMVAARNTGIRVTGGAPAPATPRPPQIVKDGHGDTVKLTLPGGR